MDRRPQTLHAVEVTFHEELCAGHFPLALEITPPQQRNPKILLRRANFLAGRVSTINVIQRPDRQSSLDAAIDLIEAGFDPVWHLATRGESLLQIGADAARAAAAGVRQALVVRGDHGSREPADAPTMRAIIAHVSERTPTLLLGATLNQYQLDNPRTMKNLLGKLDAGARYVQTQPAFDAPAFLACADRLRQERPSVPVVPMVMPLVSAESGAIITGRLGIELPPALTSVLEAGDEAAAWEYFANTLSALKESPLVAGAALMTFEMDPGADIAAHVAAALGGPVR